MTILKKLTNILAVSAFAATSFAGIARADMAEVEAAAKAEGKLSVIALPHDWCGYGEIIASFKAKYPEITVTELNPDAGSA
jgi:putative spermidine/putrescine transport system substrate-binding protein